MGKYNSAASFFPVVKTPLIKPKFDPTTPAEKLPMRMAKPNETLVSLSGSPVYSGATAVKKRGSKKGAEGNNLVKVPLGKGKTIMFPIEKGNSVDVEGNAQSCPSHLDLDEEDKEKISALKTQLDAMLKMDENAQF